MYRLVPPAYEEQGKVMFSVCLYTRREVPPGLWYQVLSRGGGPDRTGVHLTNQDRDAPPRPEQGYPQQVMLRHER